MRVLVTGGRAFDDKKFLFKTLDDLHSKNEITMLIHGDAPGADSLADQWAKLRRVRWRIAHPAQWQSLGKSAGPIRNREMLEELEPAVFPDLVVAFEGNTGTANMIDLAERAGVGVFRAVPPE